MLYRFIVTAVSLRPELREIKKSRYRVYLLFSKGKSFLFDFLYVIILASLCKGIDGIMSTILLAGQSISAHMQLEARLEALGHRIFSVKKTDMPDFVKMHPFDIIIWNLSEWYDADADILQQVRWFSDAPLLCIWKGEDSSYPEALLRDSFCVFFEVPKEEGMLEETLKEYLRAAYLRTHNMRLCQYKNLRMNIGLAKEAEIYEMRLDLTIKEHMILSLLMRHRECIYTKSVLYEAVWRQPYTGDDNAVKMHISNLRSKLKKADPEETYIETVRGLGYRLCKD